MAVFNSRTTKTRDDWLTPPHIIEALGKFDLDPCAPVNRPWPTAEQHYTVNDDGLSQPWFGRVWCNPPYGRQTKQWVKRLRQHGNGIALIPASVGAIWFHELVWRGALAVFFFNGRLAFLHPETLAPERGNNTNSALAIYGGENTEMVADALAAGKIKGKFLILRERSNDTFTH